MDNTVNNSDAYYQVALELARQFSEHKGENTLVLDLRENCSFADYFVLTTARSARHLASLSQLGWELLKEKGLPVINPDRTDPGGWALLDAGPLIVHIMEDAQRRFYELEKIWFQSKIIYSSSNSS